MNYFLYQPTSRKSKYGLWNLSTILQKRKVKQHGSISKSTTHILPVFFKRVYFSIKNRRIKNYLWSNKIEKSSLNERSVTLEQKIRFFWARETLNFYSKSWRNHKILKLLRAKRASKIYRKPINWLFSTLKSRCWEVRLCPASKGHVISYRFTLSNLFDKKGWCID